MRILALDQGTTSTRLLAAEGSGLQVLGQMRHRTSYPFPGWVEQNAAEILANCQTLLANAGTADAIALANQGESCLAWDAVTKEPLSPIIVWQDRRTLADLAQMTELADEVSRIRQTTTVNESISALPPTPYHPCAIPVSARSSASSRLTLRLTPLISVMTSPALSPAVAAGPFSRTASIRTPAVSARDAAPSVTPNAARSAARVQIMDGSRSSSILTRGSSSRDRCCAGSDEYDGATARASATAGMVVRMRAVPGLEVSAYSWSDTRTGIVVYRGCRVGVPQRPLALVW